MLRKILLAVILIMVTACGQVIDQDIEHANAEEQTIEQDENQLKNTQSSKLQAHFIDVGQANATLFQYKEDGKLYNVLFDTGDYSKKDVVNYLDANSVSKLDLVIVSHPHADHLGQMAKLMEKFIIKEVWFSGNTASTKTFQQAAEAVLAKDIIYYEPRTGDIFDVGPLTLEVLHPNYLTGDLNEDSISIRFTYGDISFLLTGDAYRKTELEMMKNVTTVKAQILQLGHHGSKESSDPEFIKSVNPNIAIYSAGKNNSYGYPHKETVTHIKREGIKLYGTDIHGTIIVTTDGVNYYVVTEKDGETSKGQGNKEKLNK